MGIFDRFRSQKGKDDKRKHVTEQQKKTFQNVPAAGRSSDEPRATGHEANVAVKDEKALKTASGTQKETKKQRRMTGPAYRVLIKPLVTEKGNDLAVSGQYLFAVDPHTNKIEIADAVEKVYGVRPNRVHVQRMRGRQVQYGRHTGFTNHWKKAVVTLPAGKTIDVFEG